MSTKPALPIILAAPTQPALPRQRIMKTILHGQVTEQHLADAALFAGIEPTSYITNGATSPPVSQRATDVIPPDPMVGDAAERQNHWRMVLRADALVCVGKNEHLVRSAESVGLLVYEVAA